MRNYRWLAIVVCALAAMVTRADEPQGSKVGSVDLNAIELRSIEGDAVSLTEAKLRVYCVIGTECPVSRFYASRLEELSKEFAERGVRFVGVHSNLHDSEEDIRKFVSELSLSFPQVRDPQQGIARELNAKRVPEVFVLDAKGFVRYSGRIDDQYAPGVKRSQAGTNHLQSAIESLLAGKDLIERRVEPVGCLITFEKQLEPSAANEFTYCKQISRLLNEHCVECHRPSEIGPFDISNYDELRGWAEMIVEVVEQKRMPPWHADPQFGSFKNERHMPDDALAMLTDWVKAGTPYGDKADLPPQPKFVDGWRLDREPELVVTMRDQPYTIPATGTVDYQYFVVDPKITEDRWVSSAQIVPGNPSVVHHAIVFVRPPDGIEFPGIGWLTAYVPGQRATIFPPGYARKIPAGSKFVFQMHYTPNGTEQTDSSQIGLTFMDASEVTHEVFTIVGIDQEFEIPPGADNHVVKSSVNRFPRDGTLLAVSPHMHLRGKSFEMKAIAKSASETESASKADETVLLKVPQYDFNWQHTYEFAEPLRFGDVQSLELTTTFDNSTANPFNPAPDEYVVWGDQTWEEMSVAFLEVAKPLKKDVMTEGVASNPKPKSNKSAVAEKKAIEPNERDVNFAKNFLARFDANKDGSVIADETPHIVRDFSFHQIDANGDRVITRDELIDAARTQRGK